MGRLFNKLKCWWRGHDWQPTGFRHLRVTDICQRCGMWMR